MTSGGNNFNYFPENQLTTDGDVRPLSPNFFVLSPLKISVTHFALPGMPLDAPG